MHDRHSPYDCHECAWDLYRRAIQHLRTVAAYEKSTENEILHAAEAVVNGRRIVDQTNDE